MAIQKYYEDGEWKSVNSPPQNKIGTTNPTTSTTGYVGQLYTNTTTLEVFQCVKHSGSNYYWASICKKATIIEYGSEDRDAVVNAPYNMPTYVEYTRSDDLSSETYYLPFVRTWSNMGGTRYEFSDGRIIATATDILHPRGIDWTVGNNNAVSYSAQSKTDAEKAQARSNIGLGFISVIDGKIAITVEV